jgi:hypothetical protein
MVWTIVLPESLIGRFADLDPFAKAKKKLKKSFDVNRYRREVFSGVMEAYVLSRL